MKSLRFQILAVILALSLFAGILPACTYTVEAAESYVAIVPAVLHSGATESLSLALLKGDAPVPGKVTFSLTKDGAPIFSVDKNVNGKGTVNLIMPAIPAGDYQFQIRGAGVDASTPVKVEQSFLIFLETDKPIYKPGQTVHIRVLTLDADLKPLTERVTIEALDAKGIKVFRTESATDEYGMADVELPLSDEPNLGVWKLTATSGKGKAQVDIRVEKYVLPKYEVKVELPKDWYLVSEQIKGKVTAAYTFGKPVEGELTIKATRYTGKWEQYATFTGAIDGTAEFQLPAVGYVAGVPGAGGSGNVTLDIVVSEKSTGYEEKTSKLLTVAQNPLSIQMIPEGTAFMPGLPFNLLIVAQTPDNKPVDTRVAVNATFITAEYKEGRKVNIETGTVKGLARVQLEPPADAIAVTINAFELTPISSRPPATVTKTIQACYSPSGNFIHLEQTSEGTPKVGDRVSFKVYATREAANFYYEVVSRGKVVFSDFTRSSEISLDVTPMMAPAGRLLVYQILPNSEVAADYLPFDVIADYPQEVDASFSKDEAKPGEDIVVTVQTQGAAKVGIAAVDKSVFILAENRMNLQQVFDELERLYMKPQAELHEVSVYSGINTLGAKDVFKNAGVIVLSNKTVPEGKEYKANKTMLPAQPPGIFNAEGGRVAVPMPTPAPMITIPAQAPSKDAQSTGGLAEVQRVRQFFPETWLWQYLTTGPNGKGSVKVTVPDSITTWMLRAVALSKEYGLGVSDAQLKAFQPFFASIDLPYSAIRGEEFPVKIAVYNYLDTPQSVVVQIKPDSWFELLGESKKTIELGASDIGAAEFKIRPAKIGFNDVQVTVQSKEAADALIKKIIIEPEGVAREDVQNLTLAGGKSKTIEMPVPDFAVPDSARTYIAVTASYLTQTMDGLDKLIQMPFGCGEQNMMLFAPDVFITRYLKQSGQLKAEIMAKAEKLMLTGYQRELVYRRSDGSFSAFGQSDQQGSLWLTAFVLKSFAQAQDLMYIDTSVLDAAKAWITSHQNSDGSFDAIGFVHHQEMVGGVSGKNALTAYVAVALMEAGETAAAARAVGYLEGQLTSINDPYTLAITTYALALAKSPKAAPTLQKLLGMATSDENGLHWGTGGVEPQPLPAEKPGIMRRPPTTPRTSDIETTAYATLALVKAGDALSAGQAAKWLTTQRNAYGGYGSTQDTVVALQALTEQAAGSRSDVDLKVRVKAGSIDKMLTVNSGNFDILQTVEVPAGASIEIGGEGKGEVIVQAVSRYNLPEAETADEILKLKVDYDTTDVEVNDLVTVSAEVVFNPPEPVEAGMVVLDVSVPTGFTPVTDTIAAVLAKDKRIKRYDVAGRKVIFYIENMLKGDRVAFSFKVQAMYPVKAKGVSSQVYSYYKPDMKGESLGADVVVR